MSKEIKVDSDAVRRLASILDDTNLSEIEYEDSGRKIRVARIATSQPVISYATPSESFTQNSTEETKEKPKDKPIEKINPKDHPGCISSPMVGTIYLASEPSAAPFVSIGDTVSKGDTLVIVEAMKVMNPIKATLSGVVKEIFAKDSMPVEFGEPLIIIE